ASKTPAPRRGPGVLHSRGPPIRETGLNESVELSRGDGPALVLALEPLDAPGRVHELLLAGVEGVTLGAHLHPDLGLGRAGVDDLSARARDGGVDVVRMNASLHGPPPRSSNHTSGSRKRQKRRPRSGAPASNPETGAAAGGRGRRAEGAWAA